MAELIGEVSVWGAECVPWSAPKTIAVPSHGHLHLKSRRLCDWQDAIRAAVGRTHRRPPYGGPVQLSITFTKQHADSAVWGQPWFVRADRPGGRGGDLSNLVKAAEDAITNWIPRRSVRWPGNVVVPGIIANDKQVVIVYARKVFGPEHGVQVRVDSVEV